MHNSGEIMNVRGEKRSEHLARRCSQSAEKVFMVQAWLPLWVRDNLCTSLHSAKKNVLSDGQNRHCHLFIWGWGGRGDAGMFFSVLLRNKPQNLLTPKSIRQFSF